MDTGALTELLLGESEAIVERIRLAYLDRVPRLAELPPGVLVAMLEATRRAAGRFNRYYVAGDLDSAGWREVRAATLQRAGETFTHAEIVDIIEAAHGAALDALDDLRADGRLDPDDHARIVGALHRYIGELAEEEDRLFAAAAPGRLDDILHELEREGADLG